MEPQDPLAQLKDIHLPEAINFWPPAPGWWLLALTVILVAVYATLLVQRSLATNRYRKLAIKQLDSFQKDNSSLYLQQVNHLIKQTILASHPEKDIAGLSGKRWLEFLDDSIDPKKKIFSTGAGTILATGPYTPTVEYQIDELEQLTQRWIKKHKITRSNPHAKL